MTNKTLLSRIAKLLLLVGVIALTASIAAAQSNPRGNRGGSVNRAIPAHVANARVNGQVDVDQAAIKAYVDKLLAKRTGPQRVVVRLTSPSVAEVVARGGRAADETAALQAIEHQQDAVIAAARAYDSNVQVLARTRMALNTVILRVDAAAVAGLAANPNVLSVRPVVDHQLALSETVPYIGATAVQQMGYDGTGVRVAVLDSGVDYTHADLGGPGTVEAYEAAYGDSPSSPLNTTRDGLFPTARVVEGYDFVGEEWPNGPEAPDPDPIDYEGHGTHVADIIGGVKGVAPGASLYAVKVCSAVDTACSGVALMQAMDYILDPNGDGNMSDRMHIVNMSLGSDMGNPIVDDLSYAVDNASKVGVLTVAAAGNGGDKPYIFGTPAAAPTAFAVAQTNVPSAKQTVMEVTKPNAIKGNYPAVHQPWSKPLTSKVTGNLVYGNGNGTNLNGCAPFTGNVRNRIVLVDRGACTFSLKISNISQAGARAGIIGLIAPGDPFQGGDGGDRPIDIPGFMVSLEVADTLREGLAAGTTTIVFDPAKGLPLVGTVVGSSARGPSMALNAGRPDIGAPGASVSAIVGTGNETGPFGGTSGATPMISGAAALLMQKYPDRSWAEIKSLLMNTAKTDITTGAAAFGGYPAPITRIGGGEVRVNSAALSGLAAWDKTALTGSLSFGFHDITDGATMSRDVVVTNYTDTPVTLDTSVEFRQVNDTGGEVAITLPDEVNVPAMGSTTIQVTMAISQTASYSLHPWTMDSGPEANNGNALTLNEYDGYIRFTDKANSANNIHMAWHVLPRGAGDVQTGEDASGAYVQNTGMSGTFIDTFSLLGISGKLSASEMPGSNQLLPDLRYVGVQTYLVPAGFCSADPSFVMAFAVNTWERQTQALPTGFDWWLDVDNDGVDDYVVFNSAAFAFNDVSNLTVVFDLAAGEGTIFFYTNQYTNSGNTTLYFCGEQIGMNADDLLNVSMDADVFAGDFYYTGQYTDAILGLNIVPYGERFLTVFGEDDVAYVELPPQSDKVPFEVMDFEDQYNKTEIGQLWFYGPGAPADNEVKAWVLRDLMVYMPVVRR